MESEKLEGGRPEVAVASEFNDRSDACDRQGGRTTKQIQDAPAGAVFVWCKEHIIYAKNIARDIGRKDLEIVPPSWLEHDHWRGRNLTGLVVDHAAHLTPRQCDGYEGAIHCVRA